jgi:HK97 family phage major capsid protein
MAAPTDRVIALRTQHPDFHTSIRGLSAKALREQKPVLVGQIRALSDKLTAEKREFTPEETEVWERVNAHYDMLNCEIEQAEDPLAPRNHAERLGAMEADLKALVGDPRIGRGDHAGTSALPPGNDGAASAIDEYQRTLAFNAWCKSQFGEFLTDEETNACRAQRLNPNCKQLRMQLLPTAQIEQMRGLFETHHPSQVSRHARQMQYGALSQQIGASGGYIVPPETLIRELEINMLYYGGMRQVAETMTTTTGERMSWPTADDTFNSGVQLGENLSYGTASVDPVFAKVFWDAYKFSSQPVLVPYELLQDSAFKLPAVLGELLGIRLGRVTNLKYTTGTGNATPKGIIPGATSFASTLSTAVFWDDIFNLIHAIDPAYRTADCGFMCHDQIVLAIRKLKSGTGEYLWQPGLQLGTPDRVLGYRLTINQNMVSTFTSGNQYMLFGQLFKYKIRRVGEMRMYRLEERYRDTDQDGFIALIREDGNLLTAGTPPVKYLQN